MCGSRRQWKGKGDLNHGDTEAQSAGRNQIVLVVVLVLVIETQIENENEDESEENVQ